MNNRIIFDIKEYVGTITKLPDGPGHEYMARGITLTEEEMDKIVELWLNRSREGE